MALYPQVRKVLETTQDAPSVSEPGFDIAAERAAARAVAAQQAILPLAEVRDVDAGGVPARLYLPTEYDGVVLHAHGGGFVLNDIEVHDPVARVLADTARMAVLSVDYRLAPEHRFPAARDDVFAALDWLDLQPELAGLPTFGHGDSAGANLALVAALRHPGRFAGLGLIYPFLDPTASYDSYRSEAVGLGAADAAWFWEQYLASPADRDDPDVAPLLSADLGTLPPTLVVTAEHDPLRDEGEDLARRLAEAGVRTVATRALGQVHGYWRHLDVFDAAEPTLIQVAGWLRSLRRT